MQQQIKKLLEDTNFKVNTLKEAKRLYANRIAPDFNIFDYLRQDEMGLSNCIASLLNPSGTHGQGNLFLDLFLNLLDSELKIKDKSIWSTTIKECSVVTENSTDEQRRIDIYLKFKNGEIIGIENKPWAGDQPQQLKHYADYIKNLANGKNWLLIYLSNYEPSEYSIYKNDREEFENLGQFVTLNYATVIQWLTQCAYESKALIVRIYIEELAKFIGIKINGELDMSEEKEMKSLILESRKNLESAFHIFNSLKSVKETLIKTFHEDLKVRLIEEKYELIWDESTSNDWKSYFGFGIKFKSEQNLYLRFEFSSPKLNGLYWGIKRENEQINNDASLWNEIRGLMNEFGAAKQSERWPWWSWIDNNQEFGSDFINWDSSETPWLCMMPDREVEDKLVEKLINLATRVEVLFKNHTNPNLLSEGVLKQ